MMCVEFRVVPLSWKYEFFKNKRIDVLLCRIAANLMKEKEPRHVWKLSEEVLHSKVDDEIVLMSMANDAYIGLDPIASRIWELLETPKDLNELCDLLMEEYEVDRKTCVRETLAFLEEMKSKGLIHRIER